MRLDRGDLERRARCTLWWCVLVLCISPIPGSWLVDHSPLHIRFPEAASIIASWENANPTPNVLILGSSRVASFVHTGELAAMTRQLIGNDSAHFFNSAVVGGEPITMEFLTSRLLGSKKQPPRLAVLEINADLLARDNLYFKLVVTRQLTAADLPKYMGDILFWNDALSRLVSSCLTPFFLHRGQLLAWAEEATKRIFAGNKTKPDEIPCSGPTQNGPDSGDKDPVPPEERLRYALAHFRTHLRHYQLSGATSSAFEATVAMLRARGCTIVLVQPPLSSAHRALFSTAMRSQFDAFVQRLHRSYACEFVDYSDRLPDTLFRDNHHANDAGSQRFTELLASEVVAPAWRKLVKQTGE